MCSCENVYLHMYTCALGYVCNASEVKYMKILKYFFPFFSLFFNMVHSSPLFYLLSFLPRSFLSSIPIFSHFLTSHSSLFTFHLSPIPPLPHSSLPSLFSLFSSFANLSPSSKLVHSPSHFPSLYILLFSSSHFLSLVLFRSLFPFPSLTLPHFSFL